MQEIKLIDRIDEQSLMISGADKRAENNRYAERVQTENSLHDSPVGMRMSLGV